MSNGKLTEPIRVLHACLAETTPLNDWRSAGLGLLEVPKKEQPDSSNSDIEMIVACVLNVPLTRSTSLKIIF